MDFLVIEIFYLLWFSLTLGTFGLLSSTRPPSNQAVVTGTTNVTIKCTSTTDGNLIKWSFTPVGTTDVKTIKNDSGITDTDTFGGYLDPKGKSYTLIIKNASSSTAGTYTCDDSQKNFALLIVLTTEPTCDFSPRPANHLPCNSTLQLSCDVSYITDRTLVTPDLTWSSDPVTAGLKSPKVRLSPSGNTTTTTSTLNATWLTGGEMPIYTCTITFKMLSPPYGMNKKPPTFHSTCQPFISASSVTCGGKDDDPTDDNKKTTVGPDGPNDEAAPSHDSSVRSAETNNLAIRVLGVAGVLLLAQLF